MLPEIIVKVQSTLYIQNISDCNRNFELFLEHSVQLIAIFADYRVSQLFAKNNLLSSRI
jgi:hypothetical protein